MMMMNKESEEKSKLFLNRSKLLAIVRKIPHSKVNFYFFILPRFPFFEMKSKIQKNNKSCKTTRVTGIKKVKYYLSKLPCEMVSAIVERMNFEDRKNLRGTSTLMKDIIDYKQKWEFKKYQQLVEPDQQIPVYHFTNNEFSPPVLHELIQHSQSNVGHLDNFERRDELLTSFYQQAQGHFDEIDVKTMFTLTMLDLLKSLTVGIFTLTRPTFSDSDIIVSFTIEKFFIAILWADSSISHFTFKEHFPSILVMLVRMLFMKKNLPFGPPISYQNFEYLDFDSKLILVGSKVDCWRQKPRAPLTLKCDLRLQGSPKTLQAFVHFMNTGLFDWEQVEEIQFSMSFFSPEARKCRFKFDFLVNFNGNSL